MRALDVGRGAAWGACSGAVYGLAFGTVLAVTSLGEERAGPLVAGATAAATYAGVVASLAGVVAGLLTAVCALALQPWLRPAVAGPVVAAVLWASPWVLTGTVDPRGHAEDAALFFLLPLVLGCTGAWWWGEGVGRPPQHPPV